MILVAIYSFGSFLKLKNSRIIVEIVGNLKGYPDNGGFLRGNKELILIAPSFISLL